MVIRTICKVSVNFHLFPVKFVIVGRCYILTYSVVKENAMLRGMLLQEDSPIHCLKVILLVQGSSTHGRILNTKKNSLSRFSCKNNLVHGIISCSHYIYPMRVSNVHSFVLFLLVMMQRSCVETHNFLVFWTFLWSKRDFSLKFDLERPEYCIFVYAVKSS